MSGGFFRGTSADQDTRFSNKQAKLLKSQKFSPELEYLVDMTKVKMDVMKPWIAKRVTELIGFEDEVLINFIYSLLEGKLCIIPGENDIDLFFTCHKTAVNGKQVQISLTGFMERNTGKFMKELWILLLSAQKNVSGVPQQFLDEKEEETKKKKAETDRIADEIQKKKEKEKQEVELEKGKMDDINASSRDKRADLEPSGKNGASGLSIQSVDEKELYKKNGYSRNSRGSRSPDSNHSPRSPRPKHSPSSCRSSGSRSHLDLRRRSRSTSRAHLSRSRSISPDRRRRSSPRRSVTPRRRHTLRRSPSPWHRSSHSRRRSTSRSRRRSRSPARYRAYSPPQYRSRSPLRRRSKSPVRRKSRTPVERSPVYRGSRMRTQRRSPSPYKGRSRSPGRDKHLYARNRGSPPFVVRRSRSPSQKRHRSPFRHSPSPSPARRRYQRSPTRSLSPVQRRSSVRGRKGSVTPVRRRSPSQESSSPSPVRQTPVRRATPKGIKSPVQSARERVSARITDPTDMRDKHEQKEPEMTYKMTGLSEKENKIHAGDDDDDKLVSKEKNVQVDDMKGGGYEEPEAFVKSSRNTELSGRNGSLDSSIDKNKDDAKEKRKQKRFDGNQDESDDNSSYDSWEERKEKKRRRKEEKKLKKEERRRRREERSRRKDERRTAKRKMKSASSSSDIGTDISEDESVQKRESRSNEIRDPKKLEVELREKALKTLRAKKGLSS